MSWARWKTLRPGDQLRHLYTGDAVWTVKEIFAQFSSHSLLFSTDAKGPRVPAPGTLLSSGPDNFIFIRTAAEAAASAAQGK